MGMKEIYGGGLFLRESNNTLIFVRSNYRVSHHIIYAYCSWGPLDGLLDQHLLKQEDFLMRDCMINWYSNNFLPC
jgi:hypothetical protein